jgi:hypothetical protein
VGTTDLWNSLELYALEVGPVLDMGAYRLALLAGAGWQRHCEPNCPFPGADDAVFSGHARLGFGRIFQTAHSQTASVALFAWFFGVHGAPWRGDVEPEIEWSRYRAGGLLSLGVELPL